tara:strand:- start:225 stop:482 length:258 start_codon:yes stop_codon:yes gene_type:complete
MASDMRAFNEKIIDEFRTNEGHVVMFAGLPMIILHTIGRKSGKTLLVPLVLTIKMMAKCCYLAPSPGPGKTQPGRTICARIRQLM